VAAGVLHFPEAGTDVNNYESTSFPELGAV
jgi:hypothetical protein